MESAPSIIVPPRPRFILDQGEILSGEFSELLQRFRQELNTIFDRESNEHASWPPENALDCFQSYSERPKLAIELAQELAQIVLELESAGGRFGDRELYAHQMGHLKWLVLSLLHDGTSYVIEGAPGTGKTAIEGFILMAATRLQMRGLLDKSILCATHRPFVLSQQALSRSERIERIKTSSSHEAKKEWEYLCSMLDEFTHDLTMQEWKHVREMHREKKEIELIRIKLRTLLRIAAVKDDEDKAHCQKILSDAELLASGQAALISDIAGAAMILPFPTLLDGQHDAGSPHGDLGIGIPDAYFRHGVVHSRREAGRPSHEKRVERGNAPAVILTTDGSVFNARGNVQNLLGDVGIFIVDEANAPATAYQEAILRAKGDGDRTNPPLGFLMSALKTTNGIGARPYANAYSPSIDILAGINRKVLPDVGVHFFPPENESLYASNTQEALDQLVDMHFREFDLPKTLHQHQPSECHSVIITDAESLDATVTRLREEYEKRGLPGTVVPFRGNTSYPQSDRVLLWMMEDETRQDGRRMAKILVSTPTLVVDALSLSGLENVTIATERGVGPETLERIFGRLQHSGLHRERGKRYRGYFIQGLYRDTLPEATLLAFFGRNIDMGTADSGEGFVERVPLETLHSQHGRALDLDTIQSIGIAAERYPLTVDALKERKEVQGTKLQRARPIDEGIHAMLYEVQPVANFEEILKHPVWSTLERIAFRATVRWNEGNPEKKWTSKDCQKAFFSIVLKKVFECLPSFMIEAKGYWEAVFEETMIHVKTNGPMHCLNALIGKIKGAVRNANRTNRFSVPSNIIFVEGEKPVADRGNDVPEIALQDEGEGERNDDELDIRQTKSFTKALQIVKKTKPKKRTHSSATS